jgi:hypothetical protein
MNSTVEVIARYHLSLCNSEVACLGRFCRFSAPLSGVSYGAQWAAP